MYPEVVGIGLGQEAEVDTIMVEKGLQQLAPHPEGTRTEIANEVEVQAEAVDIFRKSEDLDPEARAIPPVTKGKADMHLNHHRQV